MAAVTLNSYTDMKFEIDLTAGKLLSHYWDTVDKLTYPDSLWWFFRSGIYMRIQ